MKICFSFVLFFAVLQGKAQKNEPYPSSDSIKISGQVTTSQTVFMSDLSHMPDTTLASLKILNHHGEYKTTYKNVKLVLLKRLFQNNLVAMSKPKDESSIYFVCKAMDGYTAVYSYREIFKAVTEGIYIIVAYNDFNITNMPERPALLNLSNSASGNIGLRGLKSIEVKKPD